MFPSRKSFATSAKFWKSTVGELFQADNAIRFVTQLVDRMVSAYAERARSERIYSGTSRLRGTPISVNVQRHKDHPLTLKSNIGGVEFFLIYHSREVFGLTSGKGDGEWRLKWANNRFTVSGNREQFDRDIVIMMMFDD